MKFHTETSAPHRMTITKFGDAMTFPLRFTLFFNVYMSLIGWIAIQFGTLR